MTADPTTFRRDSLRRPKGAPTPTFTLEWDEAPVGAVRLWTARRYDLELEFVGRRVVERAKVVDGFGKAERVDVEIITLRVAPYQSVAVEGYSPEGYPEGATIEAWRALYPDVVPAGEWKWPRGEAWRRLWKYTQWTLLSGPWPAERSRHGGQAEAHFSPFDDPSTLPTGWW